VQQRKLKDASLESIRAERVASVARDREKVLVVTAKIHHQGSRKHRVASKKNEFFSLGKANFTPVLSPFQ